MDDIEQEITPHNEWAIQEIKRRRSLKYADPETGSDRFFTEAARMKQMGIAGWESIEAQGVLRYKQIQEEYPYPGNV